MLLQAIGCPGHQQPAQLERLSLGQLSSAASEASPAHTSVADFSFCCFKLHDGASPGRDLHSFPSLPDHCLAPQPAFHPNSETMNKISHTKAGHWLLTMKPEPKRTAPSAGDLHTGCGGHGQWVWTSVRSGFMQFPPCPRLRD